MTRELVGMSGGLYDGYRCSLCLRCSGDAPTTGGVLGVDRLVLLMVVH